MWAGSNRPGGVGRITNIHYAEGFVESVDVNYLVGCSSDKRVDLQFVKPHEDLARQSRSRKARDLFQASPAKRKSIQAERCEKEKVRKTQEERVKKVKQQKRILAADPVPAEDSDEPLGALAGLPDDVPRLLECSDKETATVSPLYLDEGLGSAKRSLLGVGGTALGVKKSLYKGFHNQGNEVTKAHRHDDTSATTSDILRKMVKENFCSNKREASGRINLQGAVKAAKMATIGVQNEQYVLDYNVDTESKKMKAWTKNQKALTAVTKEAVALAVLATDKENDENAKPEAEEMLVGSVPTLFSPELRLKKRSKSRPLPLNKSSPARRVLVTSNTNENKVSRGACTKIRPGARIPLLEVHQNEINQAEIFIQNVIGTKTNKVCAGTSVLEKPSVISVMPRNLDEARLDDFGRLLWDLFDKNDETVTRDQIASEMLSFSGSEIDHCLQNQASRNKIMMVEEGTLRTIYRI